MCDPEMTFVNPPGSWHVSPLHNGQRKKRIVCSSIQVLLYPKINESKCFGDEPEIAKNKKHKAANTWLVVAH
ncbi:hypothetical protein OUZ56_015101 [Daphnia magna]|uniref:Uncharacterized protein n=1 Tax=Daphnia magna TaxID=35525 RepID=A0ABR0ALU8_9CRUS|nr:hypothetical protein OUZ56_015101 [Daphnia magna]